MRAILFDFDFTLADSSEGAVECVSYALRRTGLPHADPARIRETIGLSIAAALERLTGVSDPFVVSEYSRHFVERADQVMADRTRIYPCVPAVLRELRACDHRLAIVSTKFRYRIESFLEREKLANLFSAVIGGEDTRRHKPDPAGLLLAVAALGSSPADCVYVGDHPVDAQAAAAAGIPFVATLTGVSRRETFDDFDALAVIADLSRLPELLASLDTGR
jgi:phosphoglycolate phosphatase